MSKAQCPYCDKHFEVDLTDGASCDQDARREEECPYCEKSCIVTVDWSVHLWSEKADCLNGGEHELQQERYPHPDVVQGEIRCRVCGHVNRRRKWKEGYEND